MQVPEVPQNEKRTRVPSTTLLFGESAQGFLSAKSLPPRMGEKVASGSFTRMRLQELL